MVDQNEIIELADEVKNTVIAHRRTIHRYAELGGKEYKTSKYICDYIRKLEIPYEMVTETAILATLDTGKSGPCIVLRADIDALLIQENPENLKQGRCCISEQANTCHACGHDAHAAMLLGSMEVLHNMKEKLNGVIYFCFESGEENRASYKQMLAALDKRKVDFVWAIHVYAALKSGKIGLRAGACMAGSGRIDITVRGRSGHGSRPDLAINPVCAAAAIVSNIPGVLVNQLNVEQTVTFGITSIKGGETFNVFPEDARILGSMRFFDWKEGEKALDIVRNVATHIGEMYHCQIKFAPVMQDMMNPVINDKVLTQKAKDAIGELYSTQNVISEDFPVFYASETFSSYCNKYPGVMVFLGIKNLEYGSGAEHHNEKFDVDENVMDLGVKATVKYVTELTENYNDGV